MKRLIPIALMLLMLTGCLGKQVAFEPVNPAEGKAVIYTYRIDEFINRAVTLIYDINGVEHGLLASGFYLPAMVDPGDALITMKTATWPHGDYGHLLIKDVKAGETYYVNCDAHPYQNFELTLVEKSVGEKEIKKTKLLINE